MKKYWRSLEERDLIRKDQTLDPGPEFPTDGLTKEEIKNRFKANRRDFLKLLGFSTAYAVAATSCQQPVRKAIPYLVRPENVTPGVADYYATVMNDGYEFAPLLAKVRDGRPIKLEPNDMVPFRGTSARHQASVLDLYDTARMKHPLKKGKKVSWNTVDKEITAKLGELAASGEKVYFITSSTASPTFEKILDEFKAKYPNVEVVYVDPVSYSALAQAHANVFGKKAVPSYRFDKADVIVGINADFLGTWLSPVEFAAQYAKTRDLTGGKKHMSKHYQYESLMSLTGSNADERIRIKPSQEKKLVLKLYNAIAGATGHAPINGAPDCKINIDKTVKDLLDAKGKSLVVSGSNDEAVQTLVAGINKMLGNYGQTVDIQKVSNLRKGDDKQALAAFEAIAKGQAGGVIFNNINPVYEFGLGQDFVNGLKKLKLSVAMTERNDETARNVTYALANSHYLESWGDAQPYTGMYLLQQPAINKLWNTRQPQENLMKWSGTAGDYHDYIQKYWQENIYPLVTGYANFDDFWLTSLQNGLVEINAQAAEQTAAEGEAQKAEAENTEAAPAQQGDYFRAHAAQLASAPKGGDLQLVLYETVAMGIGKYANNPWLQELPDPITKVVWDNYVTVSPKLAEQKGWKQEDVVKVTDGKYTVELPVVIQPGQDDHTIGIALGYGRQGVGPIGDGIGKSVSPFIGTAEGGRQYVKTAGIQVSKTGKTYPIASTQTHHVMEGRDIVRETTLRDWLKDPKSGNERHEYYKKKLKNITLYKYGYNPDDYPGHHWGMAIDLNKCTGCGACIIACQVENNIAIVGKEEVRKKRIMHWLRIDRYYAQEENELYSPIAENPEVVHQPVMCQHCDNAPCENVCPVAATPHTNEGLNSMAYNRCIGTRYCMNNCPYKVRRFNWFNFVEGGDYPYLFNDDVKRLVLNPDVVVRQRGVVEKCTMCIQRIQAGKLQAKKEGRPLKDGEIKLACEQACPTEAIIFGDTNMKDARIVKLFDDDRSYGLLEELHTLPSVVYMTKVRNKDKVAFDFSLEAEAHDEESHDKHHNA